MEFSRYKIVQLDGASCFMAVDSGHNLLMCDRDWRRNTNFVHSAGDAKSHLHG